MKKYRVVKPCKKLGKFCLGIFTALIASRMMSASVFATYSASITASNSITLNVSYSGNGVSVHDETINVVTNCTAGYNLTIATTGSSVLYLNGDSSNNTATISPVDNTYALSDLTHNANTWGYSMSGNSSTVGAFNALSTEPSTIKTTSETASETAIDDTFSIYYGTTINAELSPGSYQMSNSSTIDYYLTIAPSCADSTVVTFNENLDGAGAEGTDSTITDFPTTSDNTTDTTNNTITLSNKRPTRSGYIFKEWNTAADGTGSYYYVDETVPMGQGGLSGFVTLYAIWVANCPADTICYNDNHADGGTMTNQSATSNANNVLTSSNFNRSGYGFAGWNTAADGTGTNYGPNQTINPGNLSSTGLTLFANWIKSSGSLQSWTSASNMNVGDVIALKDDRDNEVYAVAKLADNNVWTIENLRLIPATANITIYNTNNPTSAFITSAPSTSSTTTQCSSNNVACDDQIYYYAGNMSRTATQLPTGNTSANAWYSYGVMYNWYTATAGHGSYNSTTTSGPNNDGTMAGDICPAGWHLPTGGSSGEYNTFTTAIGGTGSTGANNIRKYPNNFIYSGDYNPQNNYPDGRGQQGRLWQSTASSNSNAYRMGYNSNSITPTNTYNKWDNFAVRCIYQGGVVPFHEVTVNLGTHVTSVSFTNANYGTQQVTSSTGTVSLRQGVEYTITATFESGYTIDTWTTTSNGTLGSATSISTTYTVSDAATLSVSAQEAEEMSYILSYNAGNGTDAPDPDEVTSYNASHDFTITNSAPIYYGYTFTGWAETPGSSTVTYTSGDTLTVISAGAETTKTLYAVYTANSCPSGKICYYDNGADVNGGGRGTMSNQNASSNSSANLIPPNYSKTGYGFAGWATDANATPYGPNATITTPDISSTGLALYAKWIKSTGDLQTWSGCSSLTLNTTTALTDTRDNNTYAVTKLADDNCWIMENLRLDPGTATITSQNTNNPTSTFITQSNAGSGSSLSVDTMCNSDGSACFDQIQYNNNSKNRSLTQSHNTNTNSVAWYSYGVYYNWYTATAGRGTYNTSSNTTVVGDICPKKWRIPTGGSTGEFNALNTAVNSGSTSSDTGLRAYPVNFVWSGDYNNNKRNSSYSNGRIWTATAKDNNTAYRAGFATSTVTTSTNAYNKWDGFVVRCVYNFNAIDYNDVVVTFPTNVTSISFTNANYGIQTATPQNTTVSLVEGITYTITATFASGYTIDSWTNGTNSTIGSTSANPTTFSITDDSTLTLSAKEICGATVAANSICYNANGNNVEGTMGVQTFSSSDTSVTLLASNYSRTGYGFVGWSPDSTITNNSKIYGPQEDLTMTAGQYSATGLKLYAVWVQSVGYLQTDATTTCSGLTTAQIDGTANLSSVSALTDQRDGDTYAIAKLADGNCWMIENLRLEATATKGNNQFNPSITNESLAQGYGKSNIYGNFVGLATAETDNYSYITPPVANSIYYSGTQEGTASINIGTNDTPAYRMPRYNNLNTPNNASNRPQNPTSNSFTNDNTTPGMYSYGNYYTWHAAIADLTYYGNNNSSSSTSLCPTGWRLPKGGDKTRITSNNDNDFWNLTVIALNSGILPANYDNSNVPYYSGSTEAGPVGNKLRSFPNNFLYSGVFATSLAYYRGNGGNYWTSTSGSQYDSHILSLNEGFVYAGDNPQSKIYGRSVRCMVPAPTYSVTISPDSHISSVTFSASGETTQTATSASPTVSLKEGKSYTITVTTATSYEFASWSTTSNGTLGSATTNPTTYSVTGTATLTVITTSIELCSTVAANSICYAPNGDNMEGTMGVQTFSSSDTSVTLLASNYSRTGYGFIGWSPDSTITNNSKIYGPQEDLTMTAGQYSATGLKLYAVWVQSAGYLQTDATTTCSGLTTAPIDGTANLSSVSALTDQRDNQTYAIAKLADGNCWMIENLRLDNTTELTIANTNNPLNDGTNVTLKHNYTDTETYDTISATSSVAYDESTSPNGWCTTSSQRCFDQSRLRTDNTASRASNPTTNSDINLYSYGNYYNWYSATAGNGTYMTSNSEAGGDLCPNGWKLPYGSRSGNGNTAGGFYYLNYKLNNDSDVTNSVASKKLREFPNNFLYSGNINGAFINSRGSSGDYWSSTTYSTIDVNYLYFFNSYAYPGTSLLSKSHGNTVRCVASTQ